MSVTKPDIAFHMFSELNNKGSVPVKVFLKNVHFNFWDNSFLVNQVFKDFVDKGEFVISADKRVSLK